MMSKIVGKITGAIFIAMGYGLLRGLSFSLSQIFITILQGWFGYFIIFIGVGLLFSGVIEQNKVIAFIYMNILAFPAIGFTYFQYIIAPLSTLIMFLSIYFLPSMLFLSLANINPILEQYSQGIAYILSLLSVLFFAYRGNIVMGFIIDTLKTRLFRKYLDRYTSITFTRIYTYIIMIIIYITYNFLTLANINLNFIPFETLNAIKEVFVTFVAIDSLIQIMLKQHEIRNK